MATQTSPSLTSQVLVTSSYSARGMTHQLRSSYVSVDGMPGNRANLARLSSHRYGGPAASPQRALDATVTELLSNRRPFGRYRPVARIESGRLGSFQAR